MNKVALRIDDFLLILQNSEQFITSQEFIFPEKPPYAHALSIHYELKSHFELPNNKTFSLSFKKIAHVGYGTNTLCLRKRWDCSVFSAENILVADTNNRVMFNSRSSSGKLQSYIQNCLTQQAINTLTLHDDEVVAVRDYWYEINGKNIETRRLNNTLLSEWDSKTTRRNYNFKLDYLRSHVQQVKYPELYYETSNIETINAIHKMHDEGEISFPNDFFQEHEQSEYEYCQATDDHPYHLDIILPNQFIKQLHTNVEPFFLDQTPKTLEEQISDQTPKTLEEQISELIQEPMLNLLQNTQLDSIVELQDQNRGIENNSVSTIDFDSFSLLSVPPTQPTNHSRPVQIIYDKFIEPGKLGQYRTARIKEVNSMVHRFAEQILENILNPLSDRISALREKTTKKVSQNSVNFFFKINNKQDVSFRGEQVAMVLEGRYKYTFYRTERSTLIVVKSHTFTGDYVDVCVDDGRLSIPTFCGYSDQMKGIYEQVGITAHKIIK